jgi:hypothetical protein
MRTDQVAGGAAQARATPLWNPLAGGVRGLGRLPAVGSNELPKSQICHQWISVISMEINMIVHTVSKKMNVVGTTLHTQFRGRGHADMPHVTCAKVVVG